MPFHSPVVLRRFVSALVMIASGSVAAAQTAVPPSAAFFANLSKQCGARYEGTTTFPADPGHDFAGKLLVAELARCTDSEIRIPFAVGEDRSRTWLISLNGIDLSLKHDHRHGDGSPDAVTGYGGVAVQAGSALQQSFPADVYTAQLIPAAASNVWTLELSADGRTLSYRLQRHGQPRYEAVLKRVPPTVSGK